MRGLLGRWVSQRGGKDNSCEECGSPSSLCLLEHHGFDNSQQLRVPEAVRSIIEGWDFKLQWHI